MNIWVVDAFTDTMFSGNPAAVCIVDEFPDNETCLKIASEMKHSETAFVKPISKNHFHLRWFSPKTEVKLCGHGTLAASHILWQEKLVDLDEITFESLSDKLIVNRNQDGITLNFPAQHPSPLKEIPKDLEEILGAKAISVSTALDDLIVELQNAETIYQLNPDILKLAEIDFRAIIVTAKGDDTFDFVSRFFAPRVGIEEDPVTGSAHCKLVPFWSSKLKKNQFKAYQASERGGVLLLKLEEDRILMTGKAVTVITGSLHL